MSLVRGSSISTILLVAPLGLVVALGAGCTRTDDRPEIAQMVQHILEADLAAPSREVQTDVRDVYERRANVPLWVGDRDLARARGAVKALQNASVHGFDAADYGEPDLTADIETIAAFKQDAPQRIERLATLDVRITTALLALGRDVALGRTTPETLDRRWRARRESPDIAGTFDRLADSDLASWPDAVRPRHPEYAALEKVLGDLRAANQQEQPGINERIEQVAMNMERWRWMPDDFGARHFLVNIPSFYLQAREDGRSVKDIRVVVGKPDGHQTPIFSGEMSTVVFSPYWNIPDSIAEGETLPALTREPGYLERHHIDVLRQAKSGAKVIDPNEVDWNDPRDVKSVSFRQRPGADNALGHVKFLFPNQFDVYLHDTPADSLFARPKRAFSHGCIRVEEPEALAQYVLRGADAWTDTRIRESMFSGVEQHVKLADRIPVHIVYFTNWVDDQGVLQTFGDVYGYDAAQRRANAARGDETR